MLMVHIKSALHKMGNMSEAVCQIKDLLKLNWQIPHCFTNMTLVPLKAALLTFAFALL